MNKVHVFLENRSSCKSAMHIYCIVSKEYNCIYIGQTSNAMGPLARLNQHLSYTYYNTFIQKILSYFELDDVDFDGIDYWAYNLSTEKEVSSKDHLLSVEYLVSKYLRQLIALNKLNYSVLSRVEFGGYEDQKKIVLLADKISKDILKTLQQNQ